MTGKCLEEWVLKSGKRREEIAFKLGISTNTLYRWFKKPEVPKKAVYAFERLGYSESHDSLSAKTASGHNK